MKRVFVLALVALFAVGFSMSAEAAKGGQGKAKGSQKAALKVTLGDNVGSTVGHVNFNTTGKGDLNTNVVVNKGNVGSTAFAVILTVDGVATQVGTLTTNAKGKGHFHTKTQLPATENETVVVSISVAFVGVPAVTYETADTALKVKK